MSGAKLIGVGFVVVVSLPLGVLSQAYAVATLWLWTIVPLGIPAISWAHAYGLVALVAVVTWRGASDEEDRVETTDQKARRIFSQACVRIVAPPLVLGLVWVAMQVLLVIQ